MKKKALLLMNLGSPDSPSVADVRRYLREFLMDPFVVDIPWPVRFILVCGIIVPFRSPKSAHAYQSIWLKAGSPLIVLSQQLCAAVQQKLDSTFCVKLAMLYGRTKKKKQLQEMIAEGCDELTVLPMFPQFSTAVTTSSIEFVKQQTEIKAFKQVNYIEDFYNHPTYLNAFSDHIQSFLQNRKFDKVVFSFHGLPTRQIVKGLRPCAASCDRVNACPKITDKNRWCYRAQCYATAHSLVDHLKLKEEQFVVSFQSRLGKADWIKPYTQALLDDLAQQGLKDVVVCCPSFVCDCLETLEEIAIQAKEQWLALGGRTLELIPALNTDQGLVNAIVEISGKST